MDRDGMNKLTNGGITLPLVLFMEWCRCYRSDEAFVITAFSSRGGQRSITDRTGVSMSCFSSDFKRFETKLEMALIAYGRHYIDFRL